MNDILAKSCPQCHNASFWVFSSHWMQQPFHSRSIQIIHWCWLMCMRLPTLIESIRKSQAYRSHMFLDVWMFFFNVFLSLAATMASQYLKCNRSKPNRMGAWSAEVENFVKFVQSCPLAAWRSGPEVADQIKWWGCCKDMEDHACSFKRIFPFCRREKSVKKHVKMLAS